MKTNVLESIVKINVIFSEDQESRVVYSPWSQITGVVK